MVFNIRLYRRSDYYLLRALFGALAAAGTLVVVDDGHIVVHVDGIEFALLGAEGTSDTSGLTYAHDVLAALVAGTLYLVRLSLGHEGYDVLRAGLDAGLTAGTLVLIYNSHTVHHMDGIELTCLYAGTVAHASVLTALVIRAGNYRYGVAVLYAVIIIFLCSLAAGSSTLYESHHLLEVCISGIHAHGYGYLLCHLRSAYRAGIGGSLACSYGLGTGIAACKAAASAVGSGKELPDCILEGIGFDLELLSGYDQQYTYKEADYTDYTGGIYYTSYDIVHTSTSLNKS